MILNGWCDEDKSGLRLLNICAKLIKNEDALIQLACRIFMKRMNDTV